MGIQPIMKPDMTSDHQWKIPSFRSNKTVGSPRTMRWVAETIKDIKSTSMATETNESAGAPDSRPKRKKYAAAGTAGVKTATAIASPTSGVSSISSNLLYTAIAMDNLAVR